MTPRRVTSRAHRGTTDNTLRSLVRAAVRMADAIERPEDPEPHPDACQRFIAADEELREACLAFTRGLSATDRARLAR